MKTARDKVVGKKARLRSDRMEAQEQPREIIFARCAPAIAMRWHQSVEVVQRSAHRVSKVAQRGEKNREGKLRFENRFSSVPGRPCGMCATLVYYRTPTKETHPRATRKNSSSHRISLVQEGLNLPTDNFPLNTAGKNGRPLVTIRLLLSLSLSIYLALSHCLSSILMDSFERA